MIDTKLTESAPVKRSKAKIKVNENEPSTFENSPSEKSADSIVDYESAMIRLGGDRKLFLEFVAILQEDGPELINKIQSAIKSSDCNQLEHFGHALKGLVSNFGASECVSNALSIEKAGRAGDLDGIDDAFDRLVISHQRLQDELKSFS